MALGAERELCLSSMARALAHLGIDDEAARRWASEGVERGAALGFAWAEGFASAFEGIASTLAGDLGAAESSFHDALGIQQRLGDEEGAGLSLGGLARLAVLRGDLAAALDLYGRSLAAFEACGDRAEEARILSETGWTHLRNNDPAAARRLFLDSAQAYTDVASVRGVGLSLIGLAANEAAEGRPKQAVKIAAAAEIYAAEEGIVNVYSDETPGRELVERARRALPANELARATEDGRRLTIEEALELATRRKRRRHRPERLVKGFAAQRALSRAACAGPADDQPRPGRTRRGRSSGSAVRASPQPIVLVLPHCSLGKQLWFRLCR